MDEKLRQLAMRYGFSNQADMLVEESAEFAVSMYLARAIIAASVVREWILKITIFTKEFLILLLSATLLQLVAVVILKRK